MTTTWLVPLDDVAASDPSVVGPKMASLARLRSWGFEVPEGFTVAAGAFSELLAGDDLHERIEDFLGGVDPDDTAELEARAEQVRRLVEEAPFPSGLLDGLAVAHDELCGRIGEVNPMLAVRSSAIAEDTDDASFAGQFLTELGITGIEAMVGSVRRCWASVFSPRALAYRLRAGIALDDCPMAVGVVRLVHAASAGVAFSHHPVTGSPERQVVEATFGLGEALVSGLVTPDCAEVDSEDLRILDYRIGTKKVASAFDPAAGQVVEVPMPSTLQERRVLTDRQLATIGDGVRRIAAHFDGPVDVEWVHPAGAAEDRIVWVQARPQTVEHRDAPAPTGFLGAVLGNAFGMGGGGSR